MFDLNGSGHYLTLGWFQISYANAVVVACMIALFVAALLAPFPGTRHDDREQGR